MAGKSTPQPAANKPAKISKAAAALQARIKAKRAAQNKS